jgi:hypothetical protein
MSAIVLDRLQQHIRFEDGPLYCLQAKDQVPGTENTAVSFIVADSAVLKKYSKIDTEEVQRAFIVCNLISSASCSYD